MWCVWVLQVVQILYYVHAMYVLNALQRHVYACDATRYMYGCRHPMPVGNACMHIFMYICVPCLYVSNACPVCMLVFIPRRVCMQCRCVCVFAFMHVCVACGQVCMFCM